MKTFGFDEFVKGLQGWDVDMRLQQARVVEELCVALEGWALDEHAWQPDRPRTQGTILAYVVEASANSTTVRLDADYDAGLWLELARGGKWAWLWPVVVNHIEDIRAILAGASAAAADPVRNPGVEAEYEAAKGEMGSRSSRLESRGR